MSTVEEIEVAIQQLPSVDQERLARWFAARDAAAWDAQLQRDAQPGGKLDRLWEKAQQEIANGQAQPLDEFLNHA